MTDVRETPGSNIGLMKGYFDGYIFSGNLDSPYVRGGFSGNGEGW